MRSHIQGAERFGRAVKASDVDEVCSSYAEDVVVVDPEGAVVGRDHGRRSYARYLAAIDGHRVCATFSRMQNVISISWRSVAEDVEAVRGNETLVMQNDVIELHSFSFEESWGGLADGGTQIGPAAERGVVVAGRSRER